MSFLPFLLHGRIRFGAKQLSGRCGHHWRPFPNFQSINRLSRPETVQDYFAFISTAIYLRYALRKCKCSNIDCVACENKNILVRIFQQCLYTANTHTTLYSVSSYQQLQTFSTKFTWHL